MADGIWFGVKGLMFWNFSVSLPNTLLFLSLFFHRAYCYRTLFKTSTHTVRFKMRTKTQSLFKTLECLRLLCHPTCFVHTLDHLQGMFLAQCYFPPCCFVTNLLGYVAISSICVVVMCTSLLSVLCADITQQDRQQRGTHDNTDRRYGHIPK
jgi:hypothetical protein